MRLWHYKLLPYLPKYQLKSQWRECVCIAKNIHDNGTPNHILVNPIMNYPIEEFNDYCNHVLNAMMRRNISASESTLDKLNKYTGFMVDSGAMHRSVFDGWHDYGYLKVCMVNLWEKYRYAYGSSAVTAVEWELSCDGYKKIAGKMFAFVF